MISKSSINSIVESYGKDVTIATLCSHTALQLFHGAKQEGFKTLGISIENQKEMYSAFPLAKPDKFITVDKYSDLLNKEVQEKLIEENCVIIPHGSFVEYVGGKNIESHFEVPMLGNRQVLEWESNREKEREWLKKAGCTVPPRIKDPKDIDRPCLVKFPGAKGGKGFFIAMNEEEFNDKIAGREEYIIQEFILGTRYYTHYFYSPLNSDGFKAGKGRLEFLSIDRRIESNIDELHRFGFTREEMQKAGIEKSFVVTGNLPMVIRESLIPNLLEMGRDVVDTSIELFDPGIVGPFCLETICTPELDFYVFEISARIVAGTNLYPMGSHYTPFIQNENVSTGRRIAMELKQALETGRMNEIVY